MTILIIIHNVINKTTNKTTYYLNECIKGILKIQSFMILNLSKLERDVQLKISSLRLGKKKDYDFTRGPRQYN